MAERSINNHHDLLIIGGSAGSLDVLIKLLPSLRPDLNLAIVIVLHRKQGESLLVNLLSDKTSWPVQEVEEKDQIIKERIYIAPSDYHLLIEKDRTFSLDYSEKVNYSRPSIDVSFESAAEAYGNSLAALLLSGANADGAEGLIKVKAAGGLTLVQDPSEAVVSYMPEAAIGLMEPDYVCGMEEMIEVVNKMNI